MAAATVAVHRCAPAHRDFRCLDFRSSSRGFLALTTFWFSGDKANAPTSRAFNLLPGAAGGSLTPFFAGVSVVGFLFYPMTMEFTLIDPYASGQSPRWMLLICLLITVGFVFAGHWAAASLVLLAVGAYALHVMESTNLWDYLLDPVLFLIGLVGCAAALIGRLRSHASPPQSGPIEAVNDAVRGQ